MKELLPGLLAVEGSKNTKGIVLVRSTYYSPSFLYFQEEGLIEDLPPGTWSILGPGTADKITEDEWKGAVEYAPALSWLLKLHNLNPSTTVLLTLKTNT